MKGNIDKMKRAVDYVRCANCGKLVEKRNAKKINGVWAGKECSKDMRLRLIDGH